MHLYDTAPDGSITISYPQKNVFRRRVDFGNFDKCNIYSMIFDNFLYHFYFHTNFPSHRFVRFVRFVPFPFAMLRHSKRIFVISVSTIVYLEFDHVKSSIKTKKINKRILPSNNNDDCC